MAEPQAGKMNYAILGIRLVVGGIFIYAGIMKALDPMHFQGDIHNYKMLPRILEVLFALWLPWIEIVCGLCVLIKKLYLGAIATLLILSANFFVAIAQAWYRGLNINCGCFGADTGPSNYPLHLAGLALLAAALLFVLINEMRNGASGTQETHTIQKGTQPANAMVAEAGS